MKLIKILPFTVIPVLLVVISLSVYFVINYQINFEISTYIIFVFTTIYLLSFEKMIPHKPSWKVSKKEMLLEIKHLFISTILFDAIGNMLVLSFVLYIQEIFFEPSTFWKESPFAISFIVAVLVGEFLPYVYHRISHVGEVNSKVSLFLWKTHTIHHLPTSLNWFKTNWIHPLNTFINVVLKMLPILLLGFSKEIVFAVTIMHIIVAYASHANIKTITGILDYIIVTPKIHQFHHSKNINEAKNYGNIIPFWDFVFGTYYNRKGNVEEVGIVASNLINYPKKEKYLKQMLFPFLSK